MKIHELAKELDMDTKAVLEKARSMGIEVKDKNSTLEDIDATAVKNTIQRSKSGAETKIVKAKPKKAEKAVGKKAEIDEPKVTVKAAKIAIPVQPKTAKHHQAKTQERTVTQKPPVGKPVVPKDLEKRPKPPVGKPVVPKELEERGKNAPAPAAKPEKTETTEVKKPETAKPVEKKEKTKDAQPAAAAKKEPKPVIRQERLKIIKKASEVHEEERIAREKKEKAAAERKAVEKEKKAASDRNKERNQKRDGNKGQRRDGARPPKRDGSDSRDRRDRDNAQNQGGNRPVRKDKKVDTVLEKPSSHKKSDKTKEKKEKERDKFAKLERGGKKGGKPQPTRSLEKKVRPKKQNKPKPAPEPEAEVAEIPVGTTVINVPITVAGLAEQIQVSVSQIIMTLMKMGIMANVNQNLDEDTVVLLAEELGASVVIGKVQEEEEEEGLEVFEDKDEDLRPRAPIITVMGHVDHGKTSLLDAIRKTNVTASESGGITQHIGASEVEINGQKIVFLDTPGHEAFTAMRARGAHTTDIAVLVVAADDSVKPQTIESISHAKAAGVPIIVAINKMDKPGANPDIVKKDLAEQGVLVEDWGGDVISVPVSAKSGDGIVNLLEMILLQAEVLELKANPNRLAMGSVLEARLDKAKGPVASLLVLNGTLKAGMSVVAGTCSGKIRLMTNHKGEKIRQAGPATAVEILGLTEVPHAGDEFNAVKEDRIAREIAEHRKEKKREEVLARNSSTTLEELFSQIQEGEIKELNLIVKGDVQGSVGAIVSSLEKLSAENVRVKIVHTGVGAVTESDVMLAGTSDAIIIGFNVRPSTAVSAMAERDNIQIRTYRVIYDIIDDVENAMKGMLDPEFKEVVLGTVEIRNTFKVPGVGIVGGAYVTDGKVVRNAQIRLVRDGIVIHEGKIASLKRFKDDAKEVAQGYECGIGVESYNDIKEGDIIECFQMEEIKRD
ncbi:translation initiation factor IF-2 [Ihubacter massiliensis]|uniref:Translation initiation factor IF-2 n=1 Tax=Hominibacterium faecale TaxID=2839743 RepID=A0A9J6QP87_9FIRM|nr:MULTISPECIES: translation initiation factor IF-2 [Eubacteriales Family XIII. Incertae Sedis]MCO7121770.1 translation initiation factor IF-2 [Ihubacter massiliensis]MCU7377686.1 translation initiation factor IF-2 [Hominibacterium faecale]MCU7379176.1 translation initiation factor IF-2 [Hominibacterium faecale]MDY3013101.1 translation initiation factor IF-2 [Clostridiales Family XIII bacterium]